MATGATLNGTVNANNSSTAAEFEYGVTPAYGMTATADQSPVTGNTSTAVSKGVTGLSANTTYHYRVVATNVGGTTYGADRTFTTGSLPPTATTDAASNITATGATLNGTVNAHNDSTTVTFHYGPTMAYGMTATADQSPTTGSTGTAVSKGITGLSPGATYHYRVVAQNGSGTRYGSDMLFDTTLPDIEVSADTLAIVASNDGEVTVSGALTLTNNGTGSNLTDDVPMQFTLYDNTGCSGAQLAQWTETLAGVNIPAAGGTQTFTIAGRAITANLCVNSTDCHVSILVEADYSHTIDESDDTNNVRCTDSKLVSIADLEVTSVTPLVTCVGDGNIQGSVAIGVSNIGCSDVDNVVVRLASDCGLTFPDQPIGPTLEAGGSTEVVFPYTSGWTNCGCGFAATVDPDDLIPECEGSNNTTTSAAGTETAPDISVVGDTLSVRCVPDGQVQISGTITLSNSGCGGSLTEDIPMRFTLYDSTGCSGNQIDQWTQTLAGVSIASGGGTQSFTIAPRNLITDLCMNSIHGQVSILVEADFTDAICEVSGTANTYCADNKSVDEIAPIPRDDPRQDMVLDESAIIDPLVDVRLDGFGVYRLILRENSPVWIDVVANDTDNCSCATLTIDAIVDPPAHGTATLEDDTGDCTGGSVIRYAPGLGYVGPDQFTYRVRDACGNVSDGIATVYLYTVPEVAMEDVFVTTCASEPVEFMVVAADLWVDTDPAAIPFAFTVVAGPSHGVLIGDPTDAILTPPSRIMMGGATVPTLETTETASITLVYIPADGYTGRDAVLIRIADPFGNEATARVDIAVGACVATDRPEIEAAQGEVLRIIGPEGAILTTGSVVLVALADGLEHPEALSISFDATLSRPVLTVDAGALLPGEYVLSVSLGDGGAVDLTLLVAVAESP